MSVSCIAELSPVYCCLVLFVLLVRRILKMQLQDYKSRTRSKYHLKPSSKREVRKGEMLLISKPFQM